ncbi:MAG TPA: hypothetical protein VFT06_10370 [Flavisolibacter sp.]|nr:hypothetical protein [Flavisolibacter sp.]
MQKELQLWTVPEMKGKLAEYSGLNVCELINRHPSVVQWCVKKLGWQLSEDAKELLADKQKKETYKPIRSTSKHFFR